MNESEPKAPVATEGENTQQSIAGLQRQITILTLALLVASSTFCVFVGLQARRAKHDLAGFKGTAAQVIQDFHQQKPKLDEFVRKVAEYGNTHPDFAPILNKYRIVISNSPSPTVAPSAPTIPAAPAQPQ